MVRQIKFRMAAKTDMGLVRNNNEDNFQMAADLASARKGWVNNEVYSLGDKGALLVVADGMGGMNAGEVASELAVKTIEEWFKPESITPEVIKNRYSIEKFMNSAIVDADTRIKEEATAHPESRGMGTTIVVAWIHDGKLYVSWCGDSRAYIYNPKAGLHQITKDHSYVQSLVDKGTLTRDEAFDFPDSNIIIQSLSDSPTTARPESLMKPYDLCDGDIVLLCTDGLSGMLHDREMETVIRSNEHDMDALTSALIHSACEAEGSDNITLAVLQVLGGGLVCDPAVFEESEKWLGGAGRVPTGNLDRGEIHSQHGHDSNRIYKLITAVVVIVALIVIVLVLFIPGYKDKKEPEEKESPQQVDNISSEEEKPKGDSPAPNARKPVVTENPRQPSDTTKKNQDKLGQTPTGNQDEDPPGGSEKLTDADVDKDIRDKVDGIESGSSQGEGSDGSELILIDPTDDDKTPDKQAELIKSEGPGSFEISQNL